MSRWTGEGIRLQVYLAEACCLMPETCSLKPSLASGSLFLQAALTPGSDHLQVVGVQHRCTVLRVVVALGQRDQVLLQGVLPFLLQRPEGLVHRTVVLAHELHVLPGRHKAPHEGASPGLQRAYPAVQKLVQPLLCSPPEGRIEAGRRRHVLAEGLEQLTDVAV